MDNSKKNLAQKQIETKSQNMFFEHVKNVISEKKEKNELLLHLRKIAGVLKTDLVFNLTKDEFEILGILSFLFGIDYTGQAYPQKNVLENVNKRFEELKISEEEKSIFIDIMNTLHDRKNDIKAYLYPAFESMKNGYTQKIVVENSDKLIFNNMRSKLNRFLDSAIIPIGYSTGLVDLKKNDLTYEKLLKANSLLQEQATFQGTTVKKLVDLYGDKMFVDLMKKATTLFNETKYALLYEESITSLLDTLNRFNLHISPDTYSDEQYEEMKNNFEAENKEKETPNNQTYERKHYTEEEVKDMMEFNPNKFILSTLEDNAEMEIKSIDDLLKAIEKLIDNQDYLQHIYTYMSKFVKDEKRMESEKYLDSSIDVNTLTVKLNELVKENGEEYKKLAEYNCAKIPEDMINRIVTYIDDCIKSCILSTQDQKQYLVSQLIENGISTWNHLQQILSIIETCQITGEDALTYCNLYNYIKDKSIIENVFENGNKLDTLQIKMSVYRIFRDWFSIHVSK